MHAQNTGVTKENNLISNWLKEHGDPAIDKLVKRNLAIANWIADMPYKKNELSAPMKSDPPFLSYLTHLNFGVKSTEKRRYSVLTKK